MNAVAAPAGPRARAFVGEVEAYRLLARAGLNPPRHATVGRPLPFAAGEPVVLKGLGEDLWHKSELGAVEFLPFGLTEVIVAAAAMRQRVEAAGHRWLDGLVCERVTIARAAGLPSEGFVSLARGSAGWVILCGLGGLQADALAAMAPPLRWPVGRMPPAAALGELKGHLLGRIWLGDLRGTAALTTERKLGGFLDALWRLADLCEAEGLELLELNPVVLDPDGVPRPLDAVGRRGPAAVPRLAPPEDFLSALRAPRRVALAGVSEKPGGVGRTILDNLQRCPALAGAITIIKPGPATLLGHPCVPDVAALKAAPVDLLLLAVPAPAAAQALRDVIRQGGGARVVALVAGGIGDGADTQGLGAELGNLLTQARAEGRWTPAVLGPNFLGHWVPGAQLDTSFIPVEKLEPPAASDGGLALLSQSGAFLLCRRSRAPWLRFGFGAALGNQLDAALPDFLRALGRDPACRAVATYVEGFGPGHLVETADAADRLRHRGVPVLMLRGGRTQAGQAAAATHTGAMAGDCELERSLLERVGVRFAPSVAAFDAALEWLGAVTLPSPHPGPVALLTNAGFESVNGSDLFSGRLQGASLSAAARSELETVLAREGLTGLVTPQVPLDLTPMAGESAFLAAAEILLRESGVLVIGLVPFTRRLHTDRPGAIPFAQAIAWLRDQHGKPIAVAVDAGLEYEPYRGAFRGLGLPVFDRVETALIGLKTLAG